MREITPWLTSGDRLLCFGDSLTHSSEGYVRILQQKLSDKGIDVTNAGKGGDNVFTAILRLQKDVIDLKPSAKPTAVSIMFGTNDSQIGRGIWSKDPMIPADAFRCGLIWIIECCRRTGIEKFSIIPPLWRYESDVWMDMGDVLPPYVQAARDAAAVMNARLVPADVAFAQEWAKNPGHTGLLLTTDGCHLNTKGNQLVAETSLTTWGL